MCKLHSVHTLSLRKVNTQYTFDKCNSSICVLWYNRCDMLQHIVSKLLAPHEPESPTARSKFCQKCVRKKKVNKLEYKESHFYVFQSDSCPILLLLTFLFIGMFLSSHLKMAFSTLWFWVWMHLSMAQIDINTFQNSWV